MEKFFSEDDLAGLFDEIDEDALEKNIEGMMDDEMEASSRRVHDIIEKHKDD